MWKKKKMQQVPLLRNIAWIATQPLKRATEATWLSNLKSAKRTEVLQPPKTYVQCPCSEVIDHFKETVLAEHFLWWALDFRIQSFQYLDTGSRKVGVRNEQYSPRLTLTLSQQRITFVVFVWQTELLQQFCPMKSWHVPIVARKKEKLLSDKRLRVCHKCSALWSRLFLSLRFSS